MLKRVAASEVLDMGGATVGAGGFVNPHLFKILMVLYDVVLMSYNIIFRFEFRTKNNRYKLFKKIQKQL